MFNPNASVTTWSWSNAIFQGQVAQGSPRLPMVKKVRGAGDTILVGYADRPWCFSARPMADGRIDVAIYAEETPQQVARRMAIGPVEADKYVCLDEYPGWGFTAMSELIEMKTRWEQA